MKTWDDWFSELSDLLDRMPRSFPLEEIPKHDVMRCLAELKFHEEKTRHHVDQAVEYWLQTGKDPELCHWGLYFFRMRALCALDFLEQIRGGSVVPELPPESGHHARVGNWLLCELFHGMRSGPWMRLCALDWAEGSGLY